MIVGEIPEQTAADVEQKLKTKSGGEFHVPGPVPRGAPSRGPQFTPPQRFATFALRLQPFASEFRRRSPVCSENDAFPERKGDLNFANEHRSAAKTMPACRGAGSRAEIVVSLQTGARFVACPFICLPVLPLLVHRLLVRSEAGFDLGRSESGSESGVDSGRLDRNLECNREDRSWDRKRDWNRVDRNRDWHREDRSRDRGVPEGPEKVTRTNRKVEQSV